jgi:hypothetical protein
LIKGLGFIGGFYEFIGEIYGYIGEFHLFIGESKTATILEPRFLYHLVRNSAAFSIITA